MNAPHWLPIAILAGSFVALAVFSLLAVGMLMALQRVADLGVEITGEIEPSSPISVEKSRRSDKFGEPGKRANADPALVQIRPVGGLQ